MGWSPQGGGSGAASADELTAALGFLAATSPPGQWDAVVAASTQTLRASAVWLPAGLQITNLVTYVSVIGAATTLARLAVYDDSFDLAAATANTTSIAGSTGYHVVPLSSVYQVPAAGLFYFCELYVGTGLPTIAHAGSLGGLSSQAQMPNGVYLNWLDSGQSDLPATATPAASVTQLGLAAS